MTCALFYIALWVVAIRWLSDPPERGENQNRWTAVWLIPAAGIVLGLLGELWRRFL